MQIIILMITLTLAFSASADTFQCKTRGPAATASMAEACGYLLDQLNAELEQDEAPPIDPANWNDDRCATAMMHIEIRKILTDKTGREFRQSFAVTRGTRNQAIDSQFPSVGLCGNGAVDSGEECDDGNIANGDGCNEFCQAR